MPDKLDMIYDIVQRTEDKVDGVLKDGCPKAQNNEKRLNAKDAKGLATQSGIVGFAVAAVESARYLLSKGG